MPFQVALVSDGILHDCQTYDDAKNAIAANLTDLAGCFVQMPPLPARPPVRGAPLPSQPPPPRPTFNLPGGFQVLMIGTHREMTDALTPLADGIVASSVPIGAYMCYEGIVGESKFLVAIRRIAAQMNCASTHLTRANQARGDSIVTNVVDVQLLIDALNSAINPSQKQSMARCRRDDLPPRQRGPSGGQGRPILGQHRATAGDGTDS